MEYHHKLKLAEVDVFADEVVFSGVKGANDHSLCCVTLIRKAGKCQTPQITPRISPAQNGASLRRSNGRAESYFNRLILIDLTSEFPTFCISGLNLLLSKYFSMNGKSGA
jgi:hypothetical protein